MCSMVSRMLMYVEYLHYIICRHLRPLYMGSTTMAPLAFMMYHMALMMSGLWCLGLLCFGRMLLGMMGGCFVCILSFWSPSCVASSYCSVWSSCIVIVSSSVCL